MANLILMSPLAGWCLPIDETPDPVFAEGTAGDGVAIDPTSAVLYSPCDGEIVPVGELRHAMTVRSHEGIEILMHVGIDTVKLNGEGFEVLVRPGKRVRTGQPLMRFDLDLAARRAASAVTPIVVATPGVRVLKRVARRSVAVGDFLMEVGTSEEENAQSAGSASKPVNVARGKFTVHFAHGLHVRPATSISAALRPFSASVVIIAGRKTVSARSPTALMGLGVRSGDSVEVIAQGADAQEALAVFGELLEPLLAESPREEVAEPLARVHREVGAPVAQAIILPDAVLAGVIAHRGLASGTAFVLNESELVIPESNSDIETESVALHDALAAVRTHLEALASAPGNDGLEQSLSVLVAHAELIQDPELESSARDVIAEGKSAAFAWRHATRAAIASLDALDDARMAERAADLLDLEGQVIRVLTGRSPSLARQLPEQAIVIADEILPAQLIALDRSRIAGLCSAFGGPTSHAALLAAALDIPMVVALGPEVLSIESGSALVLDAEAGKLEVGPSAQRVAAVAETVRARQAQNRIDRAAASLSAQTTDGESMTVLANLSELGEVAGALEMGAEGCGLLRTELLFQKRADAPGEDEQAAEYQRIASALAERPLTIRTLDTGGDKPLEFVVDDEAPNPALGLRGLRSSLAHPELLRAQLAAIVRVEPHGQCRILLPMVTELDDVRAVRAVLDEICRERGVELAPELGIMIETPASALLADQLLREVDFLSIGTNDLAQYTLAMDRGNAQLASRMDALHPAVLRLIAAASEAAQSAGKSAAVCGALGSDLEAIPILMGLGIREFSAVPAEIPRIKRFVRLIALSECRVLAWEALDQSSAGAVRELSRQWRASHHNAKLLGV
jgi:phosphoenolpyruvate-protein phosphotransferase